MAMNSRAKLTGVVYKTREPNLPSPPPPVDGNPISKDGTEYNVCPTCGMWDRNVGYHRPGCGFILSSTA